MNVLFFSKSKNLEHRYLSNFQVLDKGFVIDDTFVLKELVGRRFHSIENAFQASKLCCGNFDASHLDIIEELPPVDARRYGSKGNFKKHNKVLNVEVWNRISTTIMKQLLKLRYNSDECFRDFIQEAKRNQMNLYHFERSGEKSYWGGFFKDGQWKGKNTLGRLMQEL